jgi:hypothetical protein
MGLISKLLEMEIINVTKCIVYSRRNKPVDPSSLALPNQTVLPYEAGAQCS